MDNLQESVTEFKLSFSALIAVLTSLYGWFGWAIIVLCFSLAVDYLTGYAKAAVNGEVSSDKGRKGIFKKVGYLIVVLIACGFDWIILFFIKYLGIALPFNTFFGALVIAFFILNEWTSILENLGNIGVPMPKFLKSAIEVLRQKIETEADNNLEQESEK